MIKLIKIQTQLQKTKQENNIMRESCKSCQRGFNSDNFFVCFVLLDEGREDPNTTGSKLVYLLAVEYKNVSYSDCFGKYT